MNKFQRAFVTAIHGNFALFSYTPKFFFMLAIQGFQSSFTLFDVGADNDIKRIISR
jgi:hypothetical protein